ncbi:MAG: right-handed parallel beta-helix repeat-containing protein [Actinomycetota bacterium]
MVRTLRASVAIAAVVASVLTAVPAGAAPVPKTWIVLPNESVQAAVKKAHAGDTILLVRGVYRQSVTIRKAGISIRGAGSSSGGTVFKPPATLPKGACTSLSGGSGVCVLGKFDDQGVVKKRVADVTVSGIMFAGWPSMGVFAFGTKDLRLINNAVFGAGEYGLARFDSIGGVVQNNTVVGGGEAAIYLGDSANAGATVTHNEVSGAGFGIFIRHSSGITVQLNHAFGNCQGILVLDDGQAGGVSDIELKYNYVTFNNEACPASDEGPPLQGGGILLLGAADSLVAWNTVRGNEGTEVNSGGIVLMSAADFTEGADPIGNTVKNNTVFQNLPSDISYDGTGTGNDLSSNYCGTSSPNGSCV